MRVVAYNVKEEEKEVLALANAKVHDMTLISNGLNMSTLRYAVGKDAVIVSCRDIIDASLLTALYQAGLRRIVTRSIDTTHIDVKYALDLGVHIANAPGYDDSLKGIAEQTIRSLNSWMKEDDCHKASCQCAKQDNNKLNEE